MSLAQVESRKPQSSSFVLKFINEHPLELGDVLILFYLLAVVNQYFWWVSNTSVSWLLSTAATLFVWCILTATRQFPVVRFGRSFWLIVGVPLLGAYLLRAAYPDHSFDVWNYHLLHSDRSLHGALYGPGDYFPTVLPFNPVADTLTGISRLLLGYRLGTIVNLFVLLWAAQIADRLLRPFVSSAWLRSVGVLVIVLTEHLLFEASTYMVDLMALPLLLQATYLTLNSEEAKNPRVNFLHVALLLGISTAFKLTNLAVVIPIALLCVYKLVSGSLQRGPKEFLTTSLLMLLAFVGPMVPFTIHIYRLTGNPIFPIANAVFKSPYWPTHGGWDGRWGPQGFWQTMVWPVLVWFKPERHSELALYSGRMSLGFIVAIAALLMIRRNPKLRNLSLVLIASSLLWSASALGYSRYGLFEDLLAGILIVAFISSVISNSSLRKVSWQTTIAFVLSAVVVIQTVLACTYALKTEWGGRPTVFNHPGAYLQEAKLVFRDRSLASFLRGEERARFERVQAWFETGPKSTGFEVLLRPRAPIIALRQAEFFCTRDAHQRFIDTVMATGGHDMYSVCFNADLQAAKKAIVERGLEVGAVSTLELPFFSPTDRVGLTLIEVRLPEQTAALEEFKKSWMKDPFAWGDYKQQIVALNPPSQVKPNEKLELRFRVRNLGATVWPSVGTKDFRYQVNLGSRWILNGVKTEAAHAAMNGDLNPGAETEIELTLNAPQALGDYILELDMVHEGITWFEPQGARSLRIPVRVQP